MGGPIERKFTLNDLRAARSAGTRVPFLTCYDFTTARLMQAAGVPGLLVGDSAANVILGHPTTLPVSLAFMIEITAAVRRGAPLALLIADMPFGSYQGSVGRGVRNVCLMVQLSGCDCVKIEVGESQCSLLRELSDAGVAAIAHLGLRPQSIGLMGGYRFQGRTAREAMAIVELSVKMVEAGAAGLLLEAVPAEVAAAVCEAVDVPVIGCGAGHPCHGSVVVTHDVIGLTPQAPRFAPSIASLAEPLTRAFADYARAVSAGTYPAVEHRYEMDPEQRTLFLQRSHAKRR